jgi:hypothetical protein
MYPVFEISFFDASRDSRQLKDQVPTLPHNSFGNAPCMVSLAVNIGELAYGEAMVHHCSETQAAHVVTLSVSINYQFINGVLISGNYLFDLASTGSSGNCAFIDTALCCIQFHRNYCCSTCDRRTDAMLSAGVVLLSQ